jgi:DNA-binding CsgD family transcriptional regulator
MAKQIFSLILYLIYSAILFGQNTIGLPEITNYNKKIYGAGTQSWEIQQDRDGIIYFANNEGLLTFDGNFWKLFPLPNKTIVRSLKIDQRKIYVGGQDELGYFEPDRFGTLVYHSLTSLIPLNERSFADVWDIEFFEGQIFFRTRTKIFQLSDRKMSISYSTDWRFMKTCNSQLIVEDGQRGLLRFRNGIWEPLLQNFSYPKGFLTTSLLPVGEDSVLITTFHHGIYLLHHNELRPFITADIENITSKLIYTATLADQDHVVLGTTLGGCYVIGKNGSLIQSFNRTEGLQNNNILSVFIDRNRNLWLGLDNGIDFIAYDSPIKNILTSPEIEGSGYAALVHNQTLYAGTSNGLYAVDFYPMKDLSFIKGNFKPILNTRGQVWNLSEVNGSVLMGHHEGAFLIHNREALQLDNSSGYWTFQPYYNVLPSTIMVTGTYNGIFLFNYTNGSFIKSSSAALFESARYVTIDYTNHTIWVAHPYKGIYRIRFDDAFHGSVKLYTAKNGLLNVNNNFIFKIKNHIVATTENGIFEYNAANDSFEPSAYFNSFLDQKNIRYLKEDSRGNVWFVQDKKVGVIDFSGDKPRKFYIPELTDKLVSGFEFIYPIDNDNILAGAEKGFILINYDKYIHSKFVPQVLIRTVRTFGKQDSILYAGFIPSDGTSIYHPEISNSSNSMHFEFSSTMYGQQGNMEYSFILKGYEKNWSEWSKKVEKEYTNLPNGNYTFQVKARNSLGNESTMAAYSFSILPPWYQTYWAYALYCLLILLGGYLLNRYQRKKFALQRIKYEEEQKRLDALHQLKLEKAEKELIKLRNEKLEAEIAHKNTELASTAMHLVQRGELMAKIKEEMTRLEKNLETAKASEDFKKIIKTLKEEDRMNEHWERFAIHFDKVHSDFITALKKKYPELTPNELKLSAYLRMNLSSKEVAQLMNISVRGVEISRYRLRRKLQLSTDKNLFEFLSGIQT